MLAQPEFGPSASLLVAVHQCSGPAVYPRTPPFHPSATYPEYPFPERVGAERNSAYEAVRGALSLLGLDQLRFGSPQWNPLAAVIREHEVVVIKPNMVRDFHEDRRAGLDALITHPSILRAVIDYVFLARHGRGGVIIADSPQNDADWDGLARAFQLDELIRFYAEVAPGFKIEVRECRRESVKKHRGVVVKRFRRPGDPAGYARIDLGEQSEFAATPERSGRLFGAEYDVSTTNEHHSGGVHEYLVAKTFLAADVVINLPKLKTHKKAGITVCAKSVIGVFGDKNWLPHHTEGTPAQGGDQFAEDTAKRRFERRAVAAAKRVIAATGSPGGYLGGWLFHQASRFFGRTNRDAVRSGNWHGNDTIWRTVLDGLKCWLYADKEGRLQASPQRRFVCIVDGIIAGEGNGPLAPEAREAGVVVAGLDPFAVDRACAVLMGFDPDRLKTLTRARSARGFALERVDPEEIHCASNRPSWQGRLNAIVDWLDFKPHFGWVNFLERPQRRIAPTSDSRGGAAR